MGFEVLREKDPTNGLVDYMDASYQNCENGKITTMEIFGYALPTQRLQIREGDMRNYQETRKEQRWTYLLLSKEPLALAPSPLNTQLGSM